MRITEWIVAIVFACLLAHLSSVQEQRHEAIEQASALAGMYNGVLIGRGCKIPDRESTGGVRRPHD